MPAEIEWFKNARIYHLLVDRFAGCSTKENKKDFCGGNLKSITEKLDHIVNLGVNAIWISPFYKTNKYHGYHITDYKNVEPRFGTLDDLKKLIRLANEKSIRIIADFVPNHCSEYHPYFKDARLKKESPYYNWFYFRKWPDNYKCFLGYRQLPKLNLENTETLNYIIDVAKYWISLGIDGFRIDHVIGPSHKFWNIFYHEIKNAYPDVVLFGEAWAYNIEKKYYNTLNVKHKLWRRLFGISQEKLQLEYYNKMDGILDFSINSMIIETVLRKEKILNNQFLLQKVEKHLKKYPMGYYPVTFLDNHDMNRFLYYADGNTDILLEALELLIRLNLPMILYYGTEIGMINTIPVSGKPYSDLNVREPFNWEYKNHDLYNKICKLFHK